MYLKSIELSGFKSFAKKSELFFTSSTSAIVGPNGSGKSNVAEAFRFVLGEQSLKSMRGKKGEDLIFNGAGGEARSNRATVKVVFDNHDKTFGIDFPEVSIERVVHRDGANEYLINGSQVRLKDVVELLARAHIGASGHHIISQGEADKILNASPRDRKSIIEEALGLKIYQYKRIESERKLKKTFENIAQVESLRREIAPHIRFLKKQVEKIEKAESLRSELLELSLVYFRFENEFISKTQEALALEKIPIEGDLVRLSKELAEAKHILERSAHEGQKQFVILELESEIASLRARKDAVLRELGKIEGLIGAEERIIRKQQELATSDDHKMIRLREVEDFAHAIQKDIEGSEIWDESTLRAFVRSVKERILSFIAERKNSADSSIILEAEKMMKELLKEKEHIEHSIAEIVIQETQLHEKYEALKKEIEKEKDSSHDAEKAVFRIMSEENDLISKKKLIEARETQLALEEEEYKRDLAEIGHIVGPEILKFKQASIHLNENNLSAETWVALRGEKKRAIEKFKIRLEDAGVAGSADVLKEYRDTNERDEFLARELFDLEKSAESLKELIKNLEERLTIEFSAGIERINKEFGELFTKMFGGGEARLILVKEKKKKVDVILEGEETADDTDAEDEVLQEGLDISVSLPRKKIRGLMMLSGGERALTSIALLFAISQVNPPPFIILDETDAALDEANSKKYGDMVEELSKRSQLILITHNRETMSRAGVIYGVTMSSTGVSKLLSIEFDQAVRVAK